MPGHLAGGAGLRRGVLEHTGLADILTGGRMMILEQLEAQLGENLNLLGDKLDLQIRQGDKEALAALNAMTHAWETIAVLMAAEQRAKKLGLTFAEQKHGESVVDSLFEYACESFPRAVACQRAMKALVQ